jgi:carbon monoxide dehydrogenase subunit G
MVTMDCSFELDCSEKKFFKILTDYENLSKYLPRQLQKIEILDEHDNYTTIQATVFVRSMIKKSFSQKIRIEKKSENNLSVEILDGFTKGSHVTISIQIQKEKTLCVVNLDIKLSLKTVILYPIIKREYKSFLLGAITKISIDAKQAKEEF